MLNNKKPKSPFLYNMPPMTNHKWCLAEKIIQPLKPFEEVRGDVHNVDNAYSKRTTY